VHDVLKRYHKWVIKP